jgi:hypothetical protein
VALDTQQQVVLLPTQVVLEYRAVEAGLLLLVVGE